jgi:hypothetical protein
MNTPMTRAELEFFERVPNILHRLESEGCETNETLNGIKENIKALTDAINNLAEIIKNK